MSVTRRSVLGAALVAATASLVGCRSSGAGERLATQGHTAASPSGQFAALVASAADGLRPVIRESGGETVWIDERSHDPHVYPIVVWEESADVLWVLSSEHGDAMVRHEGGRWVTSSDTEDMPVHIADLARPPAPVRR